MFNLTKRFVFEASHVLAHHDGKCKRLHGHSWQVEIVVRGEKLHMGGPKKGMVMDYGDLGAIRDKLVELLDHQHLNDVLDTDAPTCEYLARWIYEKVSPWLFGTVAKLECVTVRETNSTACTYWRP